MDFTQPIFCLFTSNFKQEKFWTIAGFEPGSTEYKATTLTTRPLPRPQRLSFWPTLTKRHFEPQDENAVGAKTVWLNRAYFSKMGSQGGGHKYIGSNCKNLMCYVSFSEAPWGLQAAPFLRVSVFHNQFIFLFKCLFKHFEPFWTLIKPIQMLQLIEDF